MASAWEFPTSLSIGGTDYEIRTDYRAVLDLLAALNDKDLEDDDKRIEAYIKSRVILEVMCLIERLEYHFLLFLSHSDSGITYI